LRLRIDLGWSSLQDPRIKDGVACNHGHVARLMREGGNSGGATYKPLTLQLSSWIQSIYRDPPPILPAME
jgi:hypothetical protein